MPIKPMIFLTKRNAQMNNSLGFSLIIQGSFAKALTKTRTERPELYLEVLW